MLLRLVEENRPIDEILYCDTGWEFPQMYDHLDRLEQTIGRPITRRKAGNGSGPQLAFPCLSLVYRAS